MLTLAEEYSIEEAMEKVIRIENKIKFSAFGKTRRQFSHKKQNNNTANNGDKNYELLKRQSDKMEKEILKVKESGQGRVGQIFK